MNWIFIVLLIIIGAILTGQFFNQLWVVMDLPPAGWGSHISIADLGRTWQSAAKKEVRIIIGKGRWRAEVAADNWSRAQGLSGRKSLPAGRGMLFVFDESARHSFWMKGMNFPLDFIWINDGRVVDITANVPPFSFIRNFVAANPLNHRFRGDDGGAFGNGAPSVIFYKPKQPANMVLEINAGEAARYGIEIGDLVKLNQ